MPDFRFDGTYTALVTPFVDPTVDESQPIDWAALDALVDAQVEGGVEGVVPCGTTGESPTLTADEYREVVRRTTARAKAGPSAKRKVKVIAGTGSYSTREAIERSRDAEKAGVDAVMVVVPYYNKPTQEGLYRHFTAVAAAVSVPVVVYNIPGRTGADLATDTLVRISEKAPNVLAVKEATGNVLRAQEIVRRLGDRVSVLSGDDALTLPMVAIGARGVISVTSNLLPAEVSRATRLALSGEFAAARAAHLALVGVHESMFVEANPAPIKAALAARGKMSAAVRPPLAPASDAARTTVLRALEAFERGAAR
jgi:4-hydroxy-tetrahydrodipicolinate synthase